jgi:phosphoglycerate dehydrogenase-like enzyme
MRRQNEGLREARVGNGAPPRMNDLSQTDADSEAKRASLPTFESLRIGIVGLGYVGLPLAVYLARGFKVVGFDVKEGPRPPRSWNSRSLPMPI